MKNRLILTCSALALSFCSLSLHAKVSESEASALGKNLNPMGGEISGNADASIPKWEGGITSPPSGYQKGQSHVNPYKDDKVLYTVTAKNLEQYKKYLSPGQIAMFDRYPDTWSMKVYPSRRSAAYPKYVYDAFKKNAREAVLTEDGNGVEMAGVTSPFPIPKSGLEAVWNHLLRFRGVKFRRLVGQAAPTANGSFITVEIEETVLLPYNKEGATSETINNRLGYFLQKVKSPAYLAGSLLLVHDTVNQAKEPRSAWVYNPGQRRVRRAPNIAYDNPGTASDGMRTTDQADTYNGSPDRYNWTLVGKRELIIPYNAYAINQGELKDEEVLSAGHLNPENLRYEIHRVWEVEGRVKEGTNHIYAKKHYFMDEDSWQIVIGDHYDARGNIWRVSEAHCINYYEVPLLWDTIQTTYDLSNGRYIAFGLNYGREIEDFDISIEESDFTPSGLRRAGKR